jgi:hypothetical protein
MHALPLPQLSWKIVGDPNLCYQITTEICLNCENLTQLFAVRQIASISFFLRQRNVEIIQCLCRGLTHPFEYTIEEAYLTDERDIATFPAQLKAMPLYHEHQHI